MTGIKDQDGMNEYYLTHFNPVFDGNENTEMEILG